MSQGRLPLISIVTPAYNGAKYLPDLIASVRDQDYPNIEHIIIDDGSTDNGATVETLKTYPHLRWWSRENRGQYPTMNEGLDSARGEIVCFISADDVMAPSAIRTAMEFLHKNPNADGVHGKYDWIDENNILYWYQPLVKQAPVSIYRYIPFIAHCSIYLRKERLIANNLHFDQSLRYTGDYDWIARIIKAKLKIGYIDQTLSLIRWHNEQTSNTKIALIKAEQENVWKMHGVNPFLFKTINVGIDRFLVAKKTLSSLFDHNEFQKVQAWLASRKEK